MQSNDQLTNHNKNGNGASSQDNATPFVKDDQENLFSPIPNTDQAVVLRQSSAWARGVTLGIVGVTTAVVIWSAFAKIEQVIAAQGQLKPSDTVKEIQAPLDGVVQEVLVKDGDKVKEGQVLVRLDPRASMAELKSLEDVRRELMQETRFYEALMGQPMNQAQVEQAIIRLKLPTAIANLARNRVALVSENRLFDLQLRSKDNPSTEGLTPDQIGRLKAARAELQSRIAMTEFENEQIRQQLEQNQIQLAEAKEQVVIDKQLLAEIKTRNEKTMAEAQKSLEIEREILADVEPLLEEGALSKLQIERQRREIIDRYKQLYTEQSQGVLDFEQQQQRVWERTSRIAQLTEENARLNYALAQGKAKLVNILSEGETRLRESMAENTKRIAEVDSQLTKIIVDNRKQMAERDGQIKRTKVNIEYQEIRSPVNGTVFDLKATRGYVPPPSQSEPLLKIVPDDNLIAEVSITNKDIGFVEVNDRADVRIDSFPFSEFGDLEGEVVSIGSDALPPDEVHQYYRFPTRIKIDENQCLTEDGLQCMEVNGKKIPLQSGMSISVNIKVREDRTVLSLFTELFQKKVESLKQTR
ncbi:MAG: HlyD family efflux transporter periplasmic adaptor subunit [Microcystaceae cyanobacterium]